LQGKLKKNKGGGGTGSVPRRERVEQPKADPPSQRALMPVKKSVMEVIK
jgi:hypothetical protein